MSELAAAIYRWPLIAQPPDLNNLCSATSWVNFWCTMDHPAWSSSYSPKKLLLMHFLDQLLVFFSNIKMASTADLWLDVELEVTHGHLSRLFTANEFMLKSPDRAITNFTTWSWLHKGVVLQAWQSIWRPSKISSDSSFVQFVRVTPENNNGGSVFLADAVAGSVCSFCCSTLLGLPCGASAWIQEVLLQTIL